MKKIVMTVFALVLALSAACGAVMFANAAEAGNAFSVKAKSAVLMDYNTGTVVYTQNEKMHLPIASMVKIMTLTLTFEEIDGGRLSVDDTVRASENAASMGGSQAFLDANSDYSVGELIKSIVVGSANDSCVALAEHIAGSVEAFVVRMNEKAKSLGMEDTVFVNCTGLPGAEQYCCAYDVALMTRELLRHEKFFDYSGVWMFDFVHPSGRITQLANTNKLLRAYEGCDGGKTGFTNEAKYCLSATAKRGETRLIAVVCGAETSKERNAQNAALFNYGFGNYETRRVIEKDVPLDGEFAVSGGKEKTVKAIPASDCYIFTPKGAATDIEYKVETVNIGAPISEGEVIGTISAVSGDKVLCSTQLLCDRNVGKLTYLDIVDEFIGEW